MPVPFINESVSAFLLSYADVESAWYERYRPRAYTRASQAFRALGESADDLLAREGIDGLRRLPGVGASIADEVAEFLREGRVAAYEVRREGLPRGFDDLVALEGMGGRLARRLKEEAAIETVADLARALDDGRRLPGVDSGKATALREAIRLAPLRRGSIPLPEARALAEAIRDALATVPGVEEIHVTGSVRRGKPLVGDLDFVARATDPRPVMRAFASLPVVRRVFSLGATRTLVLLENGVDADLVVAPEAGFGPALQYFTGALEHTVALRERANRIGLEVANVSIAKGGVPIAAPDEAAFYRALGLRWMPPEIREYTGEIEAAERGTLPRLVERTDLRGDLVRVPLPEEGVTVPDFARESRALGLAWLAAVLTAAEWGPENASRFLDGIDAPERGEFGIAYGIEAAILPDGSLDAPAAALDRADFVVAALPDDAAGGKSELTARVVEALADPRVRVLAHPSGRRLSTRTEAGIDLRRVFEEARERGVLLEISGEPDRLDLDGPRVRLARGVGARLILASGARAPAEMRPNAREALVQARRGWAGPRDIASTGPLPFPRPPRAARIAQEG
ncbi:MAG TPA: helix-hairpin-helix domain-containing protein [Candidatus Thermoplasmatota archaeon]|nr:helix-hairpin-helix domain-containing protein [Candidatus Thermoplasmatota archaeon]